MLCVANPLVVTRQRLHNDVALQWRQWCINGRHALFWEGGLTCRRRRVGRVQSAGFGQNQFELRAPLLILMLPARAAPHQHQSTTRHHLGCLKKNFRNEIIPLLRSIILLPECALYMCMYRNYQFRNKTPRVPLMYTQGERGALAIVVDISYIQKAEKEEGMQEGKSRCMKVGAGEGVGRAERQNPPHWLAATRSCSVPHRCPTIAQHTQPQSQKNSSKTRQFIKSFVILCFCTSTKFSAFQIFTN